MRPAQAAHKGPAHVKAHIGALAVDLEVVAVGEVGPARDGALCVVHDVAVLVGDDDRRHVARAVQAAEQGGLAQLRTCLIDPRQP